MHGKREKVVVAMSGGVDSSVAACLLVEQGYDVMGLFMRTGVTEPAAAPSAETPASAATNSLPPYQGGTEGGDSRSTEPPPTPPCQGGESQTPRGLKPAAQVPVASAPADRHRGCCSASDAADARFVAGMFGIPFYSLNFEREFDKLIDHFADEYAAGRTPNPCIVCNDRLKFGRIVDYADAVGAKYIATGHYARIGERDGDCVLMRGRDEKKDQSYVLFGLDRSILTRLMFPVGELIKSEVRAIAERFNLPNRNKPDSVEICFAPDRDYARVVRERRPDAFVEGNVIDQDGSVVGRHRGIGHYTVGQRRGLGIAAGVPIYVTGINVGTNTVTVGNVEALLHSSLVAGRVSFLVSPPDGSFRASVKIRYLHRAAPALVERLSDDRVRVVFDQPQRAITPGQAVVFYDDDVVIGGAWIERVGSSVAAVVEPASA